MTTTPVSNQELTEGIAVDVNVKGANRVGGDAVSNADRPCHIYVAQSFCITTKALNKARQQHG